MGRFPNGADALLTARMGVFSKLAAVQQAKGGTVYVISALGKVFLPPAELSGKEFEKFKSACANFIGFRKIDDQKYTDTLEQLAGANAKARLSPACEKFCDELIAAFPKMGDAYYYRAHVRQHMGDAEGAKADYRQAVKLGTNFLAEANGYLASPGREAGGGTYRYEVKPELTSLVILSVAETTKETSPGVPAWMPLLAPRRCCCKPFSVLPSNWLARLSSFNVSGNSNPKPSHAPSPCS